MNPHDFGIGVASERGLDAAEWEWCNLFDSHDCHIVNSELGSLSLEVVVNLTTAVDHFADLIILYEVCRSVFEHSLEPQAGLKVLHI